MSGGASRLLTRLCAGLLLPLCTRRSELTCRVSPGTDTGTAFGNERCSGGNRRRIDRDALDRRA